MRTDRLRMVERVLETVIREQREFDMYAWVEVNMDLTGVVLDHTCGFAGCAIGWAARDPEVVASGLRLCSQEEAAVRRERADVVRSALAGVRTSDSRWEVWEALANTRTGCPLYGDLSNLQAVARWADIRYELAAQLFMPGYYRETVGVPAAELVLERLRLVISGREVVL